MLLILSLIINKKTFVQDETPQSKTLLGMSKLMPRANAGHKRNTNYSTLFRDISSHHTPAMVLARLTKT